MNLCVYVCEACAHVYECVHVSLCPALCLLATHTTLSSRMHLHVGREGRGGDKDKGEREEEGDINGGRQCEGKG